MHVLFPGVEALTSVDDIDRALRFIRSEDRDIWVRVGMAIKPELGDNGYRVWDYWSQGASRYQERAAQLAWRSFKSGRITIATLFHLARQYGYRLDRKAPARPIVEKKPPSPQKNTGVYAAKIWLAADFTTVSHHPYAKAKGIDWAAGAGRATVTGAVVGKDTDCIVVAIRNIESGKVVGVQCINADGAKQTFGSLSGNGYICGNTLDRRLRWFVVEGWADAVSMVHHHYGGHAAAFAACGKSGMEKLAERVAEVFQPDRIVILEDAA